MPLLSLVEGSETEKIYLFVYGLNETTRNHVCYKASSTLLDAVRMARIHCHCNSRLRFERQISEPMSKLDLNAAYADTYQHRERQVGNAKSRAPAKFCRFCEHCKSESYMTQIKPKQDKQRFNYAAAVGLWCNTSMLHTLLICDKARFAKEEDKAIA